MKTNDFNQYVIIVDSRGVIGPQDVDTFKRHEKYGKMLKEVSPNAHLYIITASSKAEKQKITNYLTQAFVKSNKRFSLKFLIRTFLIVKSLKTGQIVLVSGDPWESGVCTKIIQTVINKVLRLETKVQVQLHADITDIEWKKRNLVNATRAKIAGIVLRRVDQIRTVSPKLKQDIVNEYRVNEDKLFVCPVALNVPRNQNKLFSKGRPNIVGFAGRFHDDRGLEEFLSYIKKISSIDSNIGIVLAGNGPKVPDFLSKLCMHVPNKNVDFLGYLKNDEMFEFWSKIGVYISTAKSESYGRSIREAAFFGIPVIGLPSSGFSELLNLGVPWIEILNANANATELESQLSKLINYVTDDSLRIRFTRDLEVNSENLVNSWMRIMPNPSR